MKGEYRNITALLLFAVFFMAACEKSSVSEEELDFKLSKIKIENQSSIPQFIFYYYNTSNNLDSIADRNFVDGRKFLYEGDRLAKIENYSKAYIFGLAPESIDSCIYDGNQLIRYEAETSVKELEYNSAGQITIIRNYIKSDSNNPKLISSQSYEWFEGNIKKHSEIDNQDIILQNFFYEYDNQINFRLNDVANLYDPFSYNKNNIVKIEFEDFTGEYNGHCTPCNLNYIYNEVGLPSSITNDRGDLESEIWEIEYFF